MRKNIKQTESNNTRDLVQTQSWRYKTIVVIKRHRKHHMKSKSYRSALLTYAIRIVQAYVLYQVGGCDGAIETNRSDRDLAFQIDRQWRGQDYARQFAVICSRRGGDNFYTTDWSVRDARRKLFGLYGLLPGFVDSSASSSNSSTAPECCFNVCTIAKYCLSGEYVDYKHRVSRFFI